MIKWGKDGGPDSHVYGLFIEFKKLFSIVLLRFDHGTREAFHTHAFNAVSWLLTGELYEEFISGAGHALYPSFKPIITRRNTFHKVKSMGTSWALSFRGPWLDKWAEVGEDGIFRVLTHGRREVPT